MYLDLFVTLPASLCLVQKTACQEGISTGDVMWVGSEGLCWPRSTRTGFESEIIEYFHYSPARLLLGVWIRSSTDERDRMMDRCSAAVRGWYFGVGS